MSNKKYDYAIFMGRFQPYHLGHHKVVTEALEKAENVIIVIGSHNRSRTIKNPFTSDERKEMIYVSIPDVDKNRVHFIAQEDYYYSDTKWLESVQKKIHAVIWSEFRAGPVKIALIGHKKDSSSYYIDMFPNWDFIDVINDTNINATDIRREYISEGNIPVEKLPIETDKFLDSWTLTNYPIYNQLVTEWKFIEKYKEQWKAAPYAPTFVTCDATVIQSGHVLLVKRKAEPGKGLWAVPGGFLNQGERIEDGIIRELIEETKINVPEKVLRGSIRTIQVFDYPERSLRGRTITHNALIVLPNGKLPKIKGSDDAEKAKWVPLAELDCSKMFEDHFDCIQILKSQIIDRK